MDPFELLESHGYSPSWDGVVAKVKIDGEVYAIKYSEPPQYSETAKNILFQYLVGVIGSLGEPFSGYSYKWLIIPDPSDNRKCAFWRDIYGKEV